MVQDLESRVLRDCNPRRFSCSGAADGSQNVIFIGSPRRFVDLLKRSRTLIIEAEFFQAVWRQLTFDVRGLKWS